MLILYQDGCFRFIRISELDVIIELKGGHGFNVNKRIRWFCDDEYNFEGGETSNSGDFTTDK